MGYAKAVRAQMALNQFLFWPPSSPDLNPIEKVWQWMKDHITQMEPFSMKLEDLKCVVQELWDEIEPTNFISTIEKMPQKCEAVIKARGMATKY